MTPPAQLLLTYTTTRKDNHFSAHPLHSNERVKANAGGKKIYHQCIFSIPHKIQLLFYFLHPIWHKFFVFGFITFDSHQSSSSDWFGIETSVLNVDSLHRPHPKKQLKPTQEVPLFCDMSFFAGSWKYFFLAIFIIYWWFNCQLPFEFLFAPSSPSSSQLLFNFVVRFLTTQKSEQEETGIKTRTKKTSDDCACVQYQKFVNKKRVKANI